MNCPKCGNELKDNSKFCSSCGEKIEEVKPVEEEVVNTPKFCSQCGEELKDNSKFCSNCGAKTIKEEEAEVQEEKELPKSEEIIKAEAFSKSAIGKTTVNVDNIKSYNKYNSNYTEKPKKAGNVVLLIAIIAVLFVASIGGLLILAGGLNFGNGKRTIMIYMVGSDLESKYGAASQDIAEILNSKYDLKNIDIILFTGGAKTWQTPEISNSDNGIYHITEDGVEKLASYDRTNMGKSETLVKLLNYGYNNYRASSYGLIFWDHGGGPIYGYGLDEFSRTDMLTLKEIDTAINQSNFKGKKLDFIGFDACLMSSIEVANTISNHAKYLISSEESEPGFGWDYTFLKDINPSSSGSDIGKNIVDRYEEFYTSIKVNGITISVLDLSKVGKVETEMNNLFASINENLDSDYYSISRTRSSTKDFGRTATSAYDLIDLYDFADKLPDAYPKEGLQSAIRELVIYEKSDVKGANGVTTYFPYLNKKKIDKSINVYSGLGFANDYLKFVVNFSSMLTGRTLDTWNLRSIKPVSKEGGYVEVEVPEEVIESYSKITYRIFEKTKSGNYVPRYQGTDYEIDDNKISTTVTKKGITATDKDGNTIYLMAFEAEQGEGYTKYLIPGTIEAFEDGKFKSTPVFVHFVVNDENPNGIIEGVTETEPDVEVASKTIIDLSKVSSVLFLGTTEYKIFDSNGEYLSNWEPVTGSKVEMIEENLNDVKIEFKDLDESKSYYAIFEINDSQGNKYSTQPVKINK